MSEEKKETVVVTRPENASEYAERRQREVAEREKVQAGVTAAAFGFGQAREEDTAVHGGGSVLDIADSTEDAISILTKGKKLPKPEGGK